MYMFMHHSVAICNCAFGLACCIIILLQCHILHAGFYVSECTCAVHGWHGGGGGVTGDLEASATITEQRRWDGQGSPPRQ